LNSWSQYWYCSTGRDNSISQPWGHFTGLYC